MGIKVSRAYPKFLNAQDVLKLCGGAFDTPYTVTIESVALREIRSFDDDEASEKLVVHFAEVPRALALNSTNAAALAELLGDDTDEWLRKHVALAVVEVKYSGRMVPGIVVREEPKPAAPAKAAKS